MNDQRNMETLASGVEIANKRACHVAAAFGLLTLGPDTDVDLLVPEYCGDQAAVNLCNLSRRWLRKSHTWAAQWPAARPELQNLNVDTAADFGRRAAAQCVSVDAVCYVHLEWGNLDFAGQNGGGGIFVREGVDRQLLDVALCGLVWAIQNQRVAIQ